MEVEKIDLYDYYSLKREQTNKGFLNACLHGYSKYYPNRFRPAIIVIAGGGYSGICEREGEPIALNYFAKGYNVFTLEYSCAPNAYPTYLSYISPSLLLLRCFPDLSFSVAITSILQGTSHMQPRP